MENCASLSASERYRGRNHARTIMVYLTMHSQSYVIKVGSKPIGMLLQNESGFSFFSSSNGTWKLNYSTFETVDEAILAVKFAMKTKACLICDPQGA